MRHFGVKSPFQGIDKLKSREFCYYKQMNVKISSRVELDYLWRGLISDSLDSSEGQKVRYENKNLKIFINGEILYNTAADPLLRVCGCSLCQITLSKFGCYSTAVKVTKTSQ